ncbi:hypothetical protein AD952_09320 [Acetobacter cerevisiae]|uniref:Uncharacterized protein n=2 Tax=Acetobacter cerevisiae TaxID=178900 RepID=A0A149UTZ0_9PROT|nr:hypothetical protein AD952_09320 [Acetobacter cerevisiae]
MWNDRTIEGRNRSILGRGKSVMSSASSPVKETLLAMIAREFKPYRFAQEMLARAANKTPRAAKNWLSGTNAPDAEALIELMASCDSIAAEVNALVQQRRKEREGEKCRGSNCGSAASYGSSTTAESHHSCM